MKKFTLTALVLGMALMLAAPAMAVDIAWDGYMRVRGFLEKDMPQNDATDDYNAYYDMRWRVNWTLNISDMLDIRSRVRILDQIGGGDNTGSENLDWRRAFMTVRTPYGTLQFGKMGTRTFGTSFLDNEGDIYRLNYITKLGGKVNLVVTAQKALEGDGGTEDFAAFQQSDGDVDVYGFALVYPTENWTLGSLQVLLRQRETAGPFVNDADRYSANPFFTGKFGALSLQAEGFIQAGDAGDGRGDYEGFAINAEANYDIGMANLMLGFAYVPGDDEGTNDVENISLGPDWEKFYILFGTTGTGYTQLGSGTGNFATGNDDGFWTIYAGADTNLTEKLNVGLSAAWVTVDEADAGVDDDAGVEVNVRATWNIYDNLSYSVIGAYLFAGDYWEDLGAGAGGNDDNPWALFHSLQLNF